MYNSKLWRSGRGGGEEGGVGRRGEDVGSRIASGKRRTVAVAASSASRTNLMVVAE